MLYCWVWQSAAGAQQCTSGNAGEVRGGQAVAPREKCCAADVGLAPVAVQQCCTATPRHVMVACLVYRATCEALAMAGMHPLCFLPSLWALPRRCARHISSTSKVAAGGSCHFQSLDDCLESRAWLLGCPWHIGQQGHCSSYIHGAADAHCHLPVLMHCHGNFKGACQPIGLLQP